MVVSINSQTGAYTRELWDRVLSSENGIMVCYGTRNEAIKARFDCYQARMVDRELSKRIHSEDSPDYDRSQWDGIRISLIKQGDKHCLVFKPSTTPLTNPVEIVEL